MPFEIIRGDITKITVEAVVNAANTSLLGGGGVDGAIHRAAGPGLLRECRSLNGCATGEAKITGAYGLPAQHVIHTVGPVYRGGSAHEEMLLKSCYRNSLELAKVHDVGSIAFPLISCGVYGYPTDQGIEIALGVFSEFLMANEMDIYLVIHDKTVHCFPEEGLRSLESHIGIGADPNLSGSPDGGKRMDISVPAGKIPGDLSGDSMAATFSQRLFELIDLRGMEEGVVCKRANMKSVLFSKFKGNPEYWPTKATALALAIALELNLWETRYFISLAGHTLSGSGRFDRIIEHFIVAGEYNIFLINRALFDFDQPQLGGW